MGSTYNVMIEWEGGEITNEPLNLIAKDNPVTCAIQASKNNLLVTNGQQRFKPIAQSEYGVEVAQNYNDVMLSYTSMQNG